MATLKPIDDAVSKYTRFVPTNPQRQLIQWSLDFRRALIFAKKNVKPGYINPENKDHLEKQLAKTKVDPSVYTPVSKPPFGNSANITDLDQEGVSLIIKDAWGEYPALHHINFPAIPRELNYNTESAFTAIKPIGRNTSKYHFTGSEDKLEFEIDWYSTNVDRDDVIRKCRTLESLSKSDGYTKPPPIVLLHWGSSNFLFMDFEFIVTAAPYRMTEFSKGYLNGDNFKDTHMLPVQAYQKLTLARVSSTNLTTLDIQSVNTF